MVVSFYPYAKSYQPYADALPLTSGYTSDRPHAGFPPSCSLASSFETHPAPRSRRHRNLPRDDRCSTKAATDGRSAYRTHSSNRVDREHPAYHARPGRPFLSFPQKAQAKAVSSFPVSHRRLRPLVHYLKNGLDSQYKPKCRRIMPRQLPDSRSTTRLVSCRPV